MDFYSKPKIDPTGELKHAIELREEKQKHTDFYMKLTELNDRITVFQNVFMSKQPRFLVEVKKKPVSATIPPSIL